MCNKSNTIRQQNLDCSKLLQDMKIARRKRAQAGNWVFQPRRCKICVSNQVEPIFSGLFSSGLVASRTVQAREEPSPKGLAARLAAPRGLDGLLQRIQAHAPMEGEPLARLGSNGSDGRHDRPPFSAQSKGDFCPRTTLSKS